MKTPKSRKELVKKKKYHQKQIQALEKEIKQLDQKKARPGYRWYD